MSKPVTAVALMTLFDEGKFSLDDPLHHHIPFFAKTMVYTPEEGGFSLQPQAEPITIRHLLTHTAGFTYGWEPGSYVDSLYGVSGVSMWDAPLEKKMKLLSTIPLKYQPGTRWEYGLSIDVAGYLTEVLSGMPLDQYMQEKIFGPLGMDDTGFYVPEEKHDRLSVLYGRDRDGNLISLGCFMGAASTSFTLYPEDDMAIMTYAQLMPSDYSYASEYRDLVRRAMKP